MVKSEASLRYIIIFITTSLTYLADNSNGYMNCKYFKPVGVGHVLNLE